MQRTTSGPRLAALAATALLAMACTSAPPAAQPQDTATPGSTATAAATITLNPTAAASATATPTSGPASPAPSADALGADLIEPGRLSICSSFPRLRYAEFDAQGNPFGVDIDIVLAIAEQMSLAADIRETLFGELIDAVVNGQCDISVSGQFITQERLGLIDMIAYREGSVSPVVPAGNPLRIDVITDLCGHSASIVEGTIYVDIMRGLGEYAAMGIEQQCEQAGQPPVELAEHPDEAKAVAALAAGEVDAFIGNEAVAFDHPQFELSDADLPRLRNGIGHRLGAATLDDALRTALRTLIDNGTYDAILDRYGVGDVGLTDRP